MVFGKDELALAADGPGTALLAGLVALLLLLAAASLNVAGTARAAETVSGGSGYFPPGTDASRGASNIILVYTGYYASGAGNWDMITALPYVAYGKMTPREPGQLPKIEWVDWFFDTYLFLGLQAPSGRAFDSPARSAPARMEDWQWYIDHLFEEGAQLDAFEAAVAFAKERGLGPADYRGKVIIMIPNPITSQRDFGDVDGDGKSESFATIGQTSKQASEARIKAVRWYVNQVLERWKAKQYQNLELIGFYWVEEQVHTSALSETPTLRTVADDLHKLGYILFWIPWFNAPGARNWRSYGFDVVIHQPNYMFNTRIPRDRLKEAAETSRTYGMGVEIEADSSILSSEAGRERYLDYLRAGVEYGYMQGAIKAYYQDARALQEAFVSWNPEVHRMYDATYEFVKGKFSEGFSGGGE
ncbi:MAG TPA: DUF4855 domain-containing protein [Firmicutes bacterium]|nr:DUF4855 domain-containing protein [Bacillota bacterium]